jgi:hypothetical protein
MDIKVLPNKQVSHRGVDYSEGTIIKNMPEEYALYHINGGSAQLFVEEANPPNGDIETTVRGFVEALTAFANILSDIKLSIYKAVTRAKNL